MGKNLKSALDLFFQFSIQFSKYSGLTHYINKTKAVWIGSNSYSADTLCDNADLSWTTEPFTILGITYTANLKDIEKLNFDKKL